MLHSVLPHHHFSYPHDDPQYVSHQCGSGLFALLEFGFHLDHGENHLERYLLPDDTHLHPILGMITSFHADVPLDWSTSTQEYTTYEDATFLRWSHHCNRFRGPPAREIG